MTVTGSVVLDDKEIASKVVALRREGRTVQQIANTLQRDRRIIAMVIKSCIASGMLDADEDAALRRRGGNPVTRTPIRSHRPGFWLDEED